MTLHGTVAAVVTPLRDGGTRLDEGAIAPLAEHVSGGGCDGVLVAGTTGEGLLLTTADALGLSVEELIRRHTSATYTVAFCGFSPGFAYLRGLDPALHVPRRPTPRTKVPAGSVAIAAGYSCVYPTSSPGGWHLLGRSDVRVFDVDRPEPALLRPGMTVSFTEKAE